MLQRLDRLKDTDGIPREDLTFICLDSHSNAYKVNVEYLEKLVDEYGELFITLYDRAKVKFHHMYHLHETIRRFNRCLSCFVTERRHRQVKKAAVQCCQTFRKHRPERRGHQDV